MTEHTVSPQALDAARVEDARCARARQIILGRLAAFGKLAFSQSKPRAPRHADTWKDKGPHESTGAMRRRLRQMAGEVTVHDKGPRCSTQRRPTEGNANAPRV